MKTILLSAAIAATALLSGCAIGPNYTTVVNPFDWRDVEHAPTSSMDTPAPSTTMGELVASASTPH